MGVKPQCYLNDLLLRPSWRVERAFDRLARFSAFLAVGRDARSASFAPCVDGYPWHLELRLVSVFSTGLIVGLSTIR